MDQATMEKIEVLARQSHRGESTFREVVERLSEIGVESYFSDYRSNRITYYATGGAVHSLELHGPAEDVPEYFDKPAVQEAISKSQKGHIQYPEFLRLSHAAGTVGYFVWIAGRHVAYFGRQGETHIERFPD